VPHCCPCSVEQYYVCGVSMAAHKQAGSYHYVGGLVVPPL
jgi:hypothetical protein